MFVTAPGISNLIQVSGKQFPRWAGDLLIASLRLQTLYRVRTRGTHVTYLEPIRIGRRIRDLAQGSDGRIVLWTDEGDLMSLSAANRLPSGEAVYRRCSGCHDAGADGTGRVAPDLRGVVGRRVASLPGFAYSESLGSLQGVWTKDRLDAFLADPPAFAPGNRMQAGALTSSVERGLLIDYLASRR